MPWAENVTPTINVYALKCARTLIVGAIIYRNSTGFISSCIPINYLKKLKKIVREKINFFKLFFP